MEEHKKIRCVHCDKVLAEVEGIRCRHCKKVTSWKKISDKIESIKVLLKR